MATLLQTNTACARPTSTTQFCVETQTTEPSDALQSHKHHPVLYRVPATGQNLGEYTEPLPPSKVVCARVCCLETRGTALLQDGKARSLISLY